VTSQYFDEDPTAPSEPQVVDVVLPDLSFRMTTDRGTFSHGRLDTGTAVLLRTEPGLPAHGDLLDLGCGSGAIAITMAMRSPGATVWAVDVNARARDRCRDNAAALGLGNVAVAPPDDVPPDVQFAAIRSNPPIRIGKPALHALLERWLARLAPDGHALLVVQRHLGADSLQAWLTAHGWPATRIASRAGFRVLQVERSPASVS
jgi:16S rRNA (guanine1207-N2)-methyltransferase